VVEDGKTTAQKSTPQFTTDSAATNINLEMDADALKSMFDLSQGQKEDTAKFTDAEAGRFKQAFEDPEFRRMFSEYMDELQDPKHREETEAYISQLEGEQKVPAGKELIRLANNTPLCFIHLADTFLVQTLSGVCGQDSQGERRRQRGQREDLHEHCTVRQNRGADKDLNGQG
jgi:hypothetical protein